MAKIYKKSELQFVEGLVCDAEGNILWIPTCLVASFNRLEKHLQKAEYLAKFKDVEPEKVPEFEFVSERNKVVLPLKPKPETPLNDARVADAMAFMEETDKVNEVEKFNDYIREHIDLFEFVEDQFVITKIAEFDEVCMFDLATIGNPLELTKDKLLEILEKTYR